MKAKILIIGHARHGKDTVAELLHKEHGYRFTDASRYIAKNIVLPFTGNLYPDAEIAYQNRVNNRDLWYHLIYAYNLTPGRALANDILVTSDLYAGVRKREEFNSCKDSFDHILWVDRSEHLPPEEGTMDLTKDDASFIINNNSTLSDLKAEIRNLANLLD